MVNSFRDEYSLAGVGAALRRRECPDDYVFDQLLGPNIQHASREYWTPLEVAVQVASWIDELGIASVVDVGSGVGKFCVAAALASNCRYLGLEHRPRLVRVAEQLANLFQVGDRVEFRAGVFGQTDTPAADAYYFFNPFEENLFGDGRIDDDVELNAARYVRDVALAEDFLQHAPVGTYLITYNGFGGVVPSGYRLINVACDLPCYLQLWKKLIGPPPESLPVEQLQYGT